MEDIAGGADDPAAAAFNADALRYVCAEHRCTGLNCEACWKFQLPTLTRVITSAHAILTHLHDYADMRLFVLVFCECLQE